MLVPRGIKKGILNGGFALYNMNYKLTSGLKQEQGDDDCKKFTITSTTRGGDLLLYKGYRYTKMRVRKNGNVAWRCVNRSMSCNASITTDALATRIIKENAHRCPPDEADNEIKKKINECLRRIQKESTSFRQVYAEAVIEYNSMGFDAIKPMPSFDSIKSTFYNHKRNAIKKTIEYFDGESDANKEIIESTTAKTE